MSNHKEILDQFKGKRVMIIGDFCLDEYIYGEAESITPEFSIPWMFVNNRSFIPGAAGNVSCGIQALGAQAIAIGVIGNDINGTILKEEMKKRGINVEGFIQSEKRKTATYSRIVCGGKRRAKQHLARFDVENKEGITQVDRDKILQQIKNQLPLVDAIIVADYDDVGGVGLITKELCTQISQLARLHNKMLIGDSRRELANFKGFTTVIPNDVEAQRLTGEDCQSEESTKRAGEKLQEILQLQAAIITRGAQGISVMKEDNMTTLPTKSTNIVDVCGGGDTVTCVMTLALISGANLSQAAELGNLAASITIAKEGTVSVTILEILNVLDTKSATGKLLAREDIESLKGEKIIFLNGFFDPLHIGHMKLINKAKELSGTLVIGLNSDQSVRENKGPERPFMNQKERIELLESMSAVDHIILFDELTPLNLIKEIKPDIIAKGNNYSKEQVLGKDFVESYGGEVALLDVIHGLTSDNILHAMKETVQSKKRRILETKEKQQGILFAEPAIVHRCQYSGRNIIAKNSKFEEGYIDNRGYVPVEWWIMSKTPAENEITKKDEGLSQVLLDNGEKISFTHAVELAEEELLGDYAQTWPLTKILDIGGDAIQPTFSDKLEVPPIPCHVHSGEIVNGKAVGPGKMEAYFFPPVNIAPYNQNFGKTITRLGLKPEVTKEEFTQRLKQFGKDDSIYDLCNVYDVNPYDGWTILAGVVHAPGPWTTFEIQRPQDDFNLASWQLGQKPNEEERAILKEKLQLRGLQDEVDFSEQVVNWQVSSDPKFKENWYRQSKVMQKGPWGRQLQIFFDAFYGEAFEIAPGYSWTRNADNRPFAGIVWSGEGMLNKNRISVHDKKRKEFLVTPKTEIKITNTGKEPLLIYTVFPIQG